MGAAADGPWLSFGAFAGARYPLDVVARVVASLTDPATVEQCVKSGQKEMVHLFSELHALLHEYALRMPSAAEAVVWLHRSARLVEVLVPRTDPQRKAELLEVYVRLSQRLRALLFGGAPGRPVAAACSDRGTGSHITLAVTVVGRDFGRAARVTLGSLLCHTAHPVEVHVVGDAEGWEAFVGAVGSGVRANFIDIWRHPRYNDILQRMPKECSCPQSRGWRPLDPRSLRIGAARLLLHELLPSHVERVIAMDVGDLLFLSDVQQLWGLFSNFTLVQMLGCALDSSAQAAVGTNFTEALHFWERRGLPRTARGVNPGVLLLHLGRLRRSQLPGGGGWSDVVLAAAREAARSGCSLEWNPQMVVLNSVLLREGLGKLAWFELPSRWNYVPEVHWELGSHNAHDGGLPAELWAAKLHPGLMPGGRLVHACPWHAELVGEWALLAASTELRLEWLRTAREYQEWFIELGAPGLYNAGVACGEEVSVVHLVGYTKLLPWARHFLQYWENRSGACLSGHAPCEGHRRDG